MILLCFFHLSFEKGGAKELAVGGYLERSGIVSVSLSRSLVVYVEFSDSSSLPKTQFILIKSKFIGTKGPINFYLAKGVLCAVLATL